MEYETKKELLFYQVDEHLKKGENIFSLTITDQMDNETIFTTTITR